MQRYIKKFITNKNSTNKLFVFSFFFTGRRVCLISLSSIFLQQFL
ncbi:hypothetical protein DW778_00610 [Odoribacter splanchnicus]|uniref:Uncharacterized protein n=1 Tax=Odoribacter splanchnicus TaxID=28118 RepID=A0A412TUJ6_9BACT|nr:hypothetical protein DWW57_06070 [Odoribacter splanchnicus]RHA42617.1 hypothetical protein DW936_04650 [Odoribacter splanchnicus]RHD87827.1 hypothetical protein DW778_00610 [Odoribacter splanchnicus]